ncbi:MAG: DUF1684 domain-containing protein [Candidatus Promineifilaceae bacterium]
MTTQLQQFRQSIDDFMKRHPQSPLDRKQRRGFQGLSYYPNNPNLIVEVDVKPIKSLETLAIPTSSGAEANYTKWGKVTFAVDGEMTTLTILSDQSGGLFLPFRDATSGSETYGAGRYMDDHRPAIEYIGRNKLRLNFNYAYSPYCAYNPNYSCPLPPRENWLTLPIHAGEKLLAH